MLGFPSLIELIKHYNAFLVSGPFLIALSLYLGIRYLKTRRALSESAIKPKQTPKPPQLVFIAGAMLIGAVHFWGIYSSVANALKFRSLDPAQVTELTIEKMEEEGRPSPGPRMSLRDPVLIQEGLRKLAGAKSRLRNHEHFLDGYRIHLRLKGPPENDYYLSVYRKSSRAGRADAVIPHIGPEGSGTVHNAGEYSCPEFLAWTSEHFDSLYNEKETKSR